MINHTQNSILLGTFETMAPDDWSRNWDVGNTMKMRMTSKTVKEIVDKMHLPAFVRLSKNFWSRISE